MHIVCSDSGEKFPFCQLSCVLPIFELPVLPVDEHSNNTLPTGVCKICNVVIYVECHLFVPDSTSHLNNLSTLIVYNEIFSVHITLLVINSFLKKSFYIIQCYVSRYK